MKYECFGRVYAGCALLWLAWLMFSLQQLDEGSKNYRFLAGEVAKISCLNLGCF